MLHKIEYLYSKAEHGGAMEHVGAEIRRIREEKGLSQLRVALDAGMGPSALSQIENGKRNPSGRSLLNLARALDVEVSDLFPKAQAPLPFRQPREEAGAERRVRAFADVLEKLYSMLASQTNNLPNPPQDDTERVRAEAELTKLLDVFFVIAEALDEQAVRDAELYSTVNAIGRKMLPKASKWLHKYGETAQLDDIDEKVKSWNQALQQGSEISR